MAENSDFLVGITPDWADRMDEMLEPGLRQVFGDLPDIKHELMPVNANKTLTAEVLRRYDAAIVFGYKVPRECLEGVEKLLCVARYGVGFDTVDIEACNEANVLVSITPGGVQRSVAEGTITLILTIAKNLRNYDVWVREGTWQQKLGHAGVNVEGRTLGTVGLGNIATEVMRLAKGVGFGRLIAADPYVSKERAAELGVELVDLPTVMRESDFVSVHAPLNSKTRGLIGAEELALMKPSAFLINTARGPVVDEAALIDALKQRRIVGAGLDVLEKEPPEKDNPLFELDNVVFSPHTISFTEEGHRDMGIEACQNVRLAYEGQVPPTLANPEVVDQPGMQAKLAARRKG